MREYNFMFSATSFFYLRFFSKMVHSSCLIFCVFCTSFLTGELLPLFVMGLTFSIERIWLAYSMKGKREVPFPGFPLSVFLYYSIDITIKII